MPSAAFVPAGLALHPSAAFHLSAGSLPPPLLTVDEALLPYCFYPTAASSPGTPPFPLPALWASFITPPPPHLFGQGYFQLSFLLPFTRFDPSLSPSFHPSTVTAYSLDLLLLLLLLLLFMTQPTPPRWSLSPAPPPHHLHLHHLHLLLPSI